MNSNFKYLEVIKKLNYARYMYEQENKEVMTNYEYDKLYDELLQFEQETGIIMANSPTQNVGYEVVSNLQKVKHEYPAKSLDKTKDKEKLKSWLGDKEGLLSWKLDGLSVVATYENGKIIKAVTRGNGEIGEDVTHNFITFKNIPKEIPYKGKLVLRGEALIDYNTFHRINKELTEEVDEYKNPRNLCSGSVRQLDSSICKSRGVQWKVFQVVNIDDLLKEYNTDSKYVLFKVIESFGFDIVPMLRVNKDTLIKTMDLFIAEEYEIPVDGLVLTYDSISYSNSLDETAKFPKHSMAFKWKDEEVETILRDVEWTVGKTGKVTCTGIFDTVEIEGTEVGRASLHNVNIIKDLQLGIGDTVSLIKSNKIIPQVVSNFTCSDNLEIPTTCPECGSELENVNGTLYCRNQYCKEKVIAQAVNMCSKNCLDIRGLSEETIRKMYDVEKESGIHRDNINFTFPLYYTYDLLLQLGGFADKSAKKLADEIQNKRKNVPFERFLASCNIPLLGNNTAKLISKNFKNLSDLHADIYSNNNKKLLSINGIGNELCDSLDDNWNNVDLLFNLIENIAYEEENNIIADSPIKDKTFVVTGDVQHFKNRKELQNKIESLGGKVAGSVSKKTDFLLNNDIESSSSKNKKAKELGVKIITEKDFLSMIGEM